MLRVRAFRGGCRGRVAAKIIKVRETYASQNLTCGDVHKFWGRQTSTGTGVIRFYVGLVDINVDDAVETAL